MPQQIRPNKRKYARISTNIPCDISTSVTKGRGYIVDFSLGGMGLATTMSLVLGSEIAIRLNAGTEEIFIFAIVINERQIMSDVMIYGVKYTRLNIFSKFRLISKIKKLFKAYHQK
jgi:c-di-GMP-binding flagellar brake protein YcgR